VGVQIEVRAHPMHFGEVLAVYKLALGIHDGKGAIMFKAPTRGDARLGHGDAVE